MNLDRIANINDINNFRGPYFEMKTQMQGFKLKVKKTLVPNVVIVNNKVCDFNKSKAYLFGGTYIIILQMDTVFFGEVQ